MLKKFSSFFRHLPSELTIEPQTLQLSDLHLRLTQAQVQDAEKMYFAQRLVYQGIVLGHSLHLNVNYNVMTVCM